MKRKSKGTTLIEIMVSLALISVVLIFIFNILADLKSEDRESTRGSRDSIKRASYTRIIQNDFIMLQLNKVAKCDMSGSLFCFQFSFKKDSPKKLVVYKDKIVYADEQWTLESSEYSKENSKFCYERTDSGDSHNHLLKITIPTKLNPNMSRKLDVELTYSSDYVIQVEGILPSVINNSCN